jgi:hypothetical protein
MPSQAVKDQPAFMRSSTRMTKSAKKKPAGKTGAMGAPKKKAPAKKTARRRTAKKTRK